MGLGKTVQVASYLSKLAKESHIRGPFLVVVPLSTLEHWLREFAGWTDLNAILYHGSADDRAIRTIFFADVSRAELKPNGNALGWRR